MSQTLNSAIAIIGIDIGNHLSRKLNSLGHDTRLMPARYVRPYSKDRRTTSTMPRRSPRQCSGRR